MKPISSLRKLPFNVGGIHVFAAVGDSNNPIADELYIENERSTRMFDLINTDFDSYTFFSMTGKDKNNLDLPLTATVEEVNELLVKNSFAVKVYDLTTGDVLGYAYKFFTNKFILTNGTEVQVQDFYKQTTPAQTSDVYAIETIIPTPPFELFYSSGFNVSVTITKNGEPFDSNPKFKSSNVDIFTVSDDGSLIGTSNTGGSATLTIYEDGLYSFNYEVLSRTE